MLVLGEKGTTEGSVPSPEAGNENPPPYQPESTRDDAGGSSAPRSHSGRERPVNFVSTNFTRIKRTNSSIKGTFVIDAGLIVPDELLSVPPRPPSSSDSSDEETGKPAQTDAQKNLYLESINSSITADVWLVDDETDVGQERSLKRADLELRSRNGSVNLKLDTNTPRPFSLILKSKNATVSVALPSDFVGPLTLDTVNGSVSLSSGMESKLVIFSEDNGTRKCFVGDYRRAGYTGGQHWSGSVAEIGSVNGKVKLSFVDEVDPVTSSSLDGGGSFLRRLFAAF